LAALITKSKRQEQGGTDCGIASARLSCGMDKIEWRMSPGLVGYVEAVAEMERRVTAIRAGFMPELVWLLEHPALYTAGTGTRPDDLLDPDFLPIFRTGRGGKLTYHGPGQRVAYVLLDLERRGRDIRAFIRDLEEWIISALARFGLRGERRDGRIGIWVVGGDGLERKIAAIGVRVRRWVSYHGISINLDPDLSHYRGIVPCGIIEHGVTSLRREGIAADMTILDAALKSAFAEIFGEPRVAAPLAAALPTP
jgi:lipoyl(octanoyl) transferase